MKFKKTPTFIGKNSLLFLTFLCGTQLSWAEESIKKPDNLNEVMSQQIPLSAVESIKVCLTKKIKMFDFPVLNAKKHFKIFSGTNKDCVLIEDKEEIELILNYTEKINVKSIKYETPFASIINIRLSTQKEQLWLSSSVDSKGDLHFQGFGSKNQKAFYFHLNYIDLKGVLSPYFKNHENFINLYKGEKNDK